LGRFNPPKKTQTNPKIQIIACMIANLIASLWFAGGGAHETT
jgi:hypothetical protein